MAPRRKEITTDDDPWRVSAFTSALVELLLSVLLLLGAAIAFLTSQLVKYSALDPPCTYIGCSHPHLPCSSKQRRYSVCCHHRSKVGRLSERLFPDRRNSWRYSELRPQSENFLSVNDDLDESLPSEKSDSVSRHSTAATSDLDIRGSGHLDEDSNGSYESQDVYYACSSSSSLIHRKHAPPKYIKSKALAFYCDGKQSAKEERVPLFPSRSISACSSDFGVDKESSPSSEDFKRPSFQEEELQREIQTDSDASTCRDNKHEHHYTLLEDEELSERNYVKQNAAIFGGDGTQSTREGLVPLCSTRSVSACSSDSDAQDDRQKSSISTDDFKKSSFQKAKLQRGTLVDADASASRETEHEHHYMLLEDEECSLRKCTKRNAAVVSSNAMQSANEDCIPFFRRSISGRDSDFDPEDDCEMSSDEFKKPSLEKEKLEGGTLLDGSALISSDFEHEHHYMLLQDDDEKLFKAPVFDSEEGLARDFEDMHVDVLSEGEDEEIAKAPFLGNLQESAQPLLEQISDGESEAPKNSMSDLVNKVSNVVLAPNSQPSSDIEQAAEKCTQGVWIKNHTETPCTSSCNISLGLGEGQNTGPPFISADEVNMESIQGFLGNSVGIMVEDQVTECDILEVEVPKEPIEDLLNIHVLEQEAFDAQGSCSPMQLESMMPKDLLQIHRVKEMTAFENGSESVLEDQLLQVHEHVEKFKFVSVKLFTAGNDACGTEISLHGENTSKLCISSDLRGLLVYDFSHRGIKEDCSISDGFIQVTQGKNDEDTMLKASEAMDHDLISFNGCDSEAMDQDLISFKVCDSEDKPATSSDNVDQNEVFGGNSLEEFEKPCHHHTAVQIEEQNSKLEEAELVLRESCEGPQGNIAVDSSFTKEAEINQSLDLMQSKSGNQISSEQMILQSQVADAEEDKEDTLLEEDREQGLDALRGALQIERMTLAALETELENERNAAAIATSEAMAMISRLQEEKSAMQMEVMQLQRMSEEKAEYDEQAMELLKEILLKREKEKHALEKEVELYRERLLAEKIDMLKKSSSEKSNKDVSMPAFTPALLLRGIDEDRDSLSAEGKIDRLKALPSLDAFYDAGLTSSPHIASMAQNTTRRELFGSSPLPVEQRETELSRVSQVGTCFQEDKGNLAESFINELHDIHQEPKGMSRSIFSTNDEETQFILERLWVLEEELRELRREDGLGSPSEAQHGGDNPMKRKCDHRCADSCGAMCVRGDMGEHRDEDGAGMLLPIHDVYEVQSNPNHPAQQNDTSKNFEDTLQDLESFPGDISQLQNAASMHDCRPRNISQARIVLSSKEAHYDSAFALNQDYPSADETHKQWLKATEGRLVTTDVIRQLAVRLQVLETDRELLREILESFRHRDAELKLLKEIARHLRELQMVGPGQGVPGGVPQGPFLPTFGESCASVLKKRRYCNGPGQQSSLLLQQKSI